MIIKYGKSGNERKAFVKAVSEIIGEDAVYQGAPTFAYTVDGWYTITRDVDLDVFNSVDSEEVENLIERLDERGFIAEPVANDEVKLTVEMPRKEFTDDPFAPPIGTHGTITGVDDTGSLLVKWDNGSGLNVVYGEDYAEKLDSVTVVCCGETEVWDSRDEAVNFYLRAMAGSEGSEHDRNANIYTQLITGSAVCLDE